MNFPVEAMQILSSAYLLAVHMHAEQYNKICRQNLYIANSHSGIISLAK